MENDFISKAWKVYYLLLKLGYQDEALTVSDLIKKYQSTLA